jgi:hypothetical protein
LSTVAAAAMVLMPFCTAASVEADCKQQRVPACVNACAQQADGPQTGCGRNSRPRPGDPPRLVPHAAARARRAALCGRRRRAYNCMRALRGRRCCGSGRCAAARGAAPPARGGAAPVSWHTRGAACQRRAEGAARPERRLVGRCPSEHSFDAPQARRARKRGARRRPRRRTCWWTVEGGGE